MKGWPWLLDQNTKKVETFTSIFFTIVKKLFIWYTCSQYDNIKYVRSLQLLNYDRDAATDPSLQNNADPSPFSLPGWKKVDKHFDYSNNLQDFSEYNLLFCYRMRRIR
jgi:hypothetical protein